MWWRRKKVRSGDRSSMQAVADAYENLQHVKDRSEEVDRVSKDYARIRRENHFSQSWQKLWEARST